MKFQKDWNLEIIMNYKEYHEMEEDLKLGNKIFKFIFIVACLIVFGVYQYFKK